jgi:hypothetical protein
MTAPDPGGPKTYGFGSTKLLMGLFFCYGPVLRSDPEPDLERFANVNINVVFAQKFLRLPQLAGKRPLVVVGPDVSLQVRSFPEGSATVVLQTTGMKPIKDSL